MSALQPLVQAVQSAFLMALSQPETCFWPCVSNHLLRTFRSYISPNGALQDTIHTKRIYLASILCFITWQGMEA